MPPRVSVVIPNWNTLRFLDMCLSSLRKQTFRNFETILADSGSTDDSLAFAAEHFPEVKTIALGENRGFAAAANAGIRASAGDLVVLLNNDTEQEENWLESLVRAAEECPEAGFFACKMVRFDDRRFLDGAGDALRLSGLPYRLGHGERDRGQFDDFFYVFGACGGAAMYRREMLDEVGLFDEDFESYCEDADLSFRAQLAGFRCLYVPDPVVYHVGGGATGGKRSETATRLGTRNSLSLLIKDLPTSAFPHVLPFFVLGQLARLLTAAATGVLRAHLRGIREAVEMLPVMLKKRRKVQSSRKVSDASTRRLLRGSSLAA
ncbi:MAG: glycosyltransferase family 2 protein, partial [Rubrobacteraceae bacterium]